MQINPLEGGQGVFLARTARATFEDSYYDDFAICDAQGLRYKTNPITTPKKVKPFKVSVYPNPAGKVIYIRVSKDESDRYLLLLSDKWRSGIEARGEICGPYRCFELAGSSEWVVCGKSASEQRNFVS